MGWQHHLPRPLRCSAPCTWHDPRILDLLSNSRLTRAALGDLDGATSGVTGRVTMNGQWRGFGCCLHAQII
jgi:hypothetical protein